MADVLKLTMSQLSFATPQFLDDKGSVVDNKTLTLVFDAADSSIAAWEKRDPTTLQPDPNGQDCIVAQRPLGTTQVHCTATNPDGTQVIVAGDVETVAKDAVSGVMNFGPAVEKP